MPPALFHGTNIEVDKLSPQVVVSDREKKRLKSDRALYATDLFSEALVHAISKAENWESHASYTIHDGKITVGVPVKEDEIDKSAKITIYRLQPDKFKYDKELNEWYCSAPVVPLSKKTMTVGEALTKFDEIKFGIRSEIPGGGEKWI